MSAMTMTPSLRKLALTTHVSVSVGWLGAVAAYLALAITGLTTRESDMASVAYRAMEVIGMGGYRAVQPCRAAERTGPGIGHGVGTVSSLLDRGEALADGSCHGSSAAAHAQCEPHGSARSGYSFRYRRLGSASHAAPGSRGRGGAGAAHDHHAFRVQAVGQDRQRSAQARKGECDMKNHTHEPDRESEGANHHESGHAHHQDHHAGTPAFSQSR